MKKALAFALVMIGCASNPPETIDEYIPENLVDREEWDGSKGQFPPG